MSESNVVGSWKVIGYIAPGATSAGVAGSTTNFKYEIGSLSMTNETAAIPASAAQVWKATNIPALNDCAANTCVWELAAVKAGNGDGVTYEATTPTNGKPLTPTFEKIGK